MTFSKTLIQWYLQNSRELPWRHSQDPYTIWLSEIILQQTRVAQGLPYFNAFLDAYPTVFDLANASEQEVLKLWQGLGYYSRARNLHYTAQYIANDCKGQFPKTFKELKKLKGVGAYTAAAIASFCFRERVPVVDGNVYRVLSRYFGIQTNIASSKAFKEFFDFSESLIQTSPSDIYNQALMEFGALQCLPKSPSCETCVFNDSCFAFLNNKVKLLPIKVSKVKVVSRYFNYLMINDALNNFKINKRDREGIWQNLYEFDLYETFQKVDINEVEAYFKRMNEYEFESFFLINNQEIIHKLTHQKLHINFFFAKVKGIHAGFLPLTSAINYPFPIVIADFLNNNIHKLKR